MQSKTITNVVTYGLLSAAGIVAFTLPQGLGPQISHAQAGNDAATIRLNGVIRDFKVGHPDFGVMPSGGNGHYAGNVESTLNSYGRPSFVGTSAGNPMTNFTISNGNVVPSGPFVPMVTLIDSQMGTSNKVTTNIHIGSATLTPFGPFTDAVAGNVNGSGNPRKYVHPTLCDPSTSIWLEGRSWTNSSSGGDEDDDQPKVSWSMKYSFSSASDPAQVKVLRDGDMVPTVSGASGQTSLKDMLKDFVDSTGTKVTLQSNQAIWFFELWTTDTKSSAFDMQDVVMLVTLGDSAEYLNTLDAYGNSVNSTATALGYKVASEWKDNKGNAIPPHLFNVGATGDVAGAKGAIGTGGISSEQSFDQWYSDQMGINLSARYDVVLTQDAGGVWQYLNDNFYPIDKTLLGNQSASHNYFFTYNFSATFTHRAGQHRFVEFKGADDLWMYIDGKLAMDLGGVIPGTAQYLDVDRIPALTDGQPHSIQFFYAQRNTTTSVFRLRTNLDLSQQTTSYAVSGTGD